MMQEIKKRFFTYRNGVVADALRRYGTPHKVIFGLEIPRIAEIARGLLADETLAQDRSARAELAQRLWDDSEVRESRLLATYLFPVEGTTIDLAMRLAAETRTQEESDMLAFRLLKRLPNAADLLTRLTNSPDTPSHRTAASLRNHLS